MPVRARKKVSSLPLGIVSICCTVVRGSTAIWPNSDVAITAAAGGGGGGGASDATAGVAIDILLINSVSSTYSRYG